MNRRDWLISTLSMATWPEILAAQEHARAAAQSAEPPAFGYLDKPAAADIEALASEIIPSGDTPGSAHCDAPLLLLEKPEYVVEEALRS